jgi:N-acetylmuramoyl-L-alanine amidase-like protein
MAIRKFVLLVAGHGGGDPGAVGQGSTEAQETIQIVDRVYDLLVQHPNILVERVPHNLDYVDSVAWANGNYLNIDDGVVVEVHKNSSAAAAHGNEVLVPSGSDGTNQNLAAKIQAQLTEQTGLPSRGVKERNDLYLIREINMYAVLAECGFQGWDPIDDDADAKFARAIANGVCDFFGEARVGAHVPVPPIVQPPAPDTTDMFYRLMIDGKQKAAYSTDRNAYNGYVYYGLKGEIKFKNNNVTAELVAKYAPAPPVVVPPVIPPVVVPPVNTPTPYDKEQDSVIEKITSVLAGIGKAIADFLASLKKG